MTPKVGSAEKFARSARSWRGLMPGMRPLKSAVERGARPRLSVVLSTSVECFGLPTVWQDLVAQPMAEFELVVVDLASAPQVIEPLRETIADARLRVMRLNRPLPLLFALREGLKCARGPRIWLTTRTQRTDARTIGDLVEAGDLAAGAAGGEWLVGSAAALDDAIDAVIDHAPKDPAKVMAALKRALSGAPMR